MKKITPPAVKIRVSLMLRLVSIFILILTSRSLLHKIDYIQHGWGKYVVLLCTLKNCQLQ